MTSTSWKQLEDNGTYSLDSWRTRINRLASYINADIHSVMDLGCGERYLGQILRSHMAYYPVDYISRGANTILCDFNKREFPNIKADCIFISGCLEYIKEVDWFLDQVTYAAQKQIVISYTALEYFPNKKQRREKAYQHDFLTNQLIQMFHKRGFVLLKLENTTCALMSFERVSPRNLTDQFLCNECRLCYDFCKQGARTKDGSICKYDQNKCIGCNECITLCPVLNCPAPRNQAPKWWSEDFREMLNIEGDQLLHKLAEAFLLQSGIVFYPAYNGAKKLVEYIEVTTMDQMSQIEFNFLSKPLGTNHYHMIENAINEGKKVLFVGVACAIACLKQFLIVTQNKSADNILFVEVQDDYLPPGNLLTGYLEARDDLENAADINLEKANEKWALKALMATGETEIIPGKNFPYIHGLNRKLFIDAICEHCVYKGKNLGDILLEKGKKPVIRKKALTLRDRFYDLNGRMPIDQALTYTLNKQWDIVYVGWFGIKNYGAELTHFALYSFLREQGYEVLMAQTPQNARRKPSKAPQLFRNNPYKAYDIAPIYQTKSQMYELNAYAPVFMVGSDQLWKKSSFELSGSIYDLEFIESDKRKIAYATSFGYEYYLGNAHDIASMKKSMQLFDAISVRENSGVDLCRDIFDISAVRCMDPVFLCNKTHYIRLAETSHRDFRHSIGAFFLDLLPEKLTLVEHIAESLHTDYYICTDPKRQLAEYEAVIEKNICVEDLLKMIMDCDYIITDSMHVSCFSIIFKKQFVTIANEKGRVGSRDRIYSLFQTLGIMDRMIEECENTDFILSILQTDINYAKVHTWLDREIAYSKNWLLQSLENIPEKITEQALLWERIVKSEYHLEQLCQNSQQLCQDVQQMRQDFQQLQKENEAIRREITVFKHNIFFRAENWLKRKVKSLKKQ